MSHAGGRDLQCCGVAQLPRKALRSCRGLRQRRVLGVELLLWGEVLRQGGCCSVVLRLSCDGVGMSCFQGLPVEQHMQ
jgi:hypothetical protein